MLSEYLCLVNATSSKRGYLAGKWKHRFLFFFSSCLANYFKEKKLRDHLQVYSNFICNIWMLLVRSRWIINKLHTEISTTQFTHRTWRLPYPLLQENITPSSSDNDYPRLHIPAPWVGLSDILYKKTGSSRICSIFRTGFRRGAD